METKEQLENEVNNHFQESPNIRIAKMFDKKVKEGIKAKKPSHEIMIDALIDAYTMGYRDGFDNYIGKRLKKLGE